MRHRTARRRLAALDRAGLRRKMVRAEPEGAYVRIGKRRLLNLSSNDYLGLGGASAPRAQSASSSRLLSGNAPEYGALERSLASHRAAGASLVFPTGYMANIGAVCALAQKGDLIVSDELNHASIIDACRLSGARTEVYAHNDIGSLESKLAKGGANKFVITEGVFSMDGDVPDLAGIAEAAVRHGATSILDDAHGDFVLGGGRGAARACGADARIDVHTSSLSKALGSIGGYVAADPDVVDLIVNTARPFIYTSALPRFALGHVAQRLRAPKSARRKRLAANTALLHRALDSLGLGIDGRRTQIAPIIVGDERRALELGRRLYRAGVLAQAIRYPTVARGSARLRISVTARPAPGPLGRALDALGTACRRLGVA